MRWVTGTTHTRQCRFSIFFPACLASIWRVWTTPHWAAVRYVDPNDTSARCLFDQIRAVVGVASLHAALLERNLCLSRRFLRFCISWKKENMPLDDNIRLPKMSSTLMPQLTSSFSMPPLMPTPRTRYQPLTQNAATPQATQVATQDTARARASHGQRLKNALAALGSCVSPLGDVQNDDEAFAEGLRLADACAITPAPVYRFVHAGASASTPPDYPPPPSPPPPRPAPEIDRSRDASPVGLIGQKHAVSW